jgi:TRAP-type C4-dicarboxylate transport system permease small subunit
MLTNNTKEPAAESSGDGYRRNKVVRLIVGILESGAVILMGSLAVLVFVNAVGRYLFASPLPWTEEIVLNILVWLAAIGVVLASLNRSLISCEMITRRLSGTGARALAVASALVAVGVMLYFSWLTWRYLLLFGADLSPILHIPKSVMILGLFFATLSLSATLLVPILKR